MGVHMVFRIILVLWSVIVFAQAASLAKSSCQDRCGNVSVPFPFGIGAGCYVDDWFAIVCNGSMGSPRPFLRSFDLEVLEIQLDGTVRVKYPTARTCTKNETGVDSVLLESPFVFSQSKNRFTVMGCNNYASMKSLDTMVTYGGCSSRCEQSGSIVIFNASSCNGINCCQIDIPSDLNAFITDLDQIIHNDTSQECRYAFLVEEEWFETNNVVPNVSSVPVVLEWGIHSTSFHSLLPVLDNSNSSDTSRTYNCSVHSPLESNQNLSFSCSCQYGYEGNPYLLGGCQDINECEVPDGYPCLKQWLKDTESRINNYRLRKEKKEDPNHYSCENTNGSYACHIIPYTQDPSKSKSMKLIIKGISLGLGPLLLFGGGWLSYEMVKKRKMIKRREKFFKRNGGLLLQQQLSSNAVNVESTKLFNSKDLEKATDGFNANRILGKGGQSTVYKGMLVDGGIVAVKKSKVIDEGKLQEFINEVVILSRINLRNVVKLLGCCLETEVPMLVYEFVPNGTLSQYLNDQNEEFSLTWDMRLRIAIEVAGALFYLHSAASSPIYHRDIKSSNILLDDKYRAKVADFGTSRSIEIDQTHVTTLVHGTFGYLDPEYFQSSQFTEKSDVYSFGVVLAELLTGERAISSTMEHELRSLTIYFVRSMEENNLFAILDNRVLKEGEEKEIIAVANLTRRCLNLKGKKRPTMKEVAMELEAIQLSREAPYLQQSFEEAIIGTEM